MLPFDSLLTQHRELGLIVAVLIGFGFGFVLERAGFGNASKLAAQFYLHDMTVFKVMFSAIVTAMLGVMLAWGFGVIDLRALSESAVSFTYLGPMLVGGLVLGAGFIISGYCPGTSVVGAASGKLDAVLTFSGVILGSILYGEIFPLLSSFHTSGDKGHLFLYDLTGIPAPILAAAITLMALAMFFGAEKVEVIFSKKRGAPVERTPETRRSRVLAFGALSGLTVLMLGTLAIPRQPLAENRSPAQLMSQEALAARILNEPWTLRILDLRATEHCAKARIPGAECTPSATIDKLGLAYDSGARDLVLVPWQTQPAPTAALAYPGRVFVLNDGWNGWKRYALTRPAAPTPDAGEAELAAYEFRASLHAAMTGRKPAPPPPKSGAYVPTKKKKKGGGCS